MRILVQKQLRGFHEEVGINRLAVTDLIGHTLKVILRALGKDGEEQRDTTANHGAHESGDLTDDSTRSTAIMPTFRRTWCVSDQPLAKAICASVRPA